MTVSECCLIKLLPYILFEKTCIFSTESGQRREPALCQSHRRTSVPYNAKQMFFPVKLQNKWPKLDAVSARTHSRRTDDDIRRGWRRPTVAGFYLRPPGGAT